MSGLRFKLAMLDKKHKSDLSRNITSKSLLHKRKTEWNMFVGKP